MESEVARLSRKLESQTERMGQMTPRPSYDDGNSKGR